MFRIVFFGTSDFAVPSLEALAQDGRFEIAAVVTQPDRPVGRHAVLTPPPIKRAAEKLGLPIFQPEQLSELRATRYELRATSYVVISYGKILPQWLLDIPKKGAINVHASLLPRWRGASPIQAAIAAGDEKSGVTIMRMDAELDHGPILATKEEPITATDTGGSLHDRLADLGAAMLPSTLADYLNDKIEPKAQNHDEATLCRTLTRDDGKIDWAKSATEIERLVRAYNPWPGTWTEWNGKRLKILETSVTEPNPSRLQKMCGDGKALELVTVQPEGGKPISGRDFLNGVGHDWVR